MCGSEKLDQFKGEFAIHFPGLKNLDKPVVWVFPEVWACLNCGNAEFWIPERELFVLTLGSAAAGDSILASPVLTE
jgi:hypothetical protein